MNMNLRIGGRETAQSYEVRSLLRVFNHMFKLIRVCYKQASEISLGDEAAQ